MKISHTSEPLVNPREPTNAHPFDFYTEAELAVAHYCAPEREDEAFARQMMFRWQALDKSHLERVEGDFCPWDCKQCDALNNGPVYPHEVTRG